MPEVDNSTIRFPKLPHELDKRRVLTLLDISEMKDLRSQGLSSRRIAAMYCVSKTIVLYHTNDDEYREKVNKKRYSLIKQRESVDEKYKQKRKESKREDIKSVMKRSEEKRKYKGKLGARWKKKKRSADEEFRKKDNAHSLKSYHKKRQSYLVTGSGK